MKQIFIEAKAKIDSINLAKKDINRLPKRVGLVSTIQFVDSVKDIKKILEKNKKKCVLGKGRQRYKPQVLGCEFSAAGNVKEKVDAFLYVGSGDFHPIGIALNTGKRVFCFNPAFNSFSEFKEKEIDRIRKKRKGALVKFISSKKVGILVSTKPGQQNLKLAIKMKKKLKEKGKESFIFLFNTLEDIQMENFPFVESWVNTACPRISDSILTVKGLQESHFF
jgi:2-(3-amino-3-carboxypropyl)histidine synthase